MEEFSLGKEKIKKVGRFERGRAHNFNYKTFHIEKCKKHVMLYHSRVNIGNSKEGEK